MRLCLFVVCSLNEGEDGAHSRAHWALLPKAHTPEESSRAKTDSDIKHRSSLTRIFKKEEECYNHMVAGEL